MQSEYYAWLLKAKSYLDPLSLLIFHSEMAYSHATYQLSDIWGSCIPVTASARVWRPVHLCPSRSLVCCTLKMPYLVTLYLPLAYMFFLESLILIDLRKILKGISFVSFLHIKYNNFSKTLIIFKTILLSNKLKYSNQSYICY